MIEVGKGGRRGTNDFHLSRLHLIAQNGAVVNFRQNSFWAELLVFEQSQIITIHMFIIIYTASLASST